MVSEITRLYCQSSVFRQGVQHAPFYDELKKSDHDFLIAFHGNFISGMLGFQDDEVLLQAVYEIIMIFPLRVASCDFS